MPTEFRDLASAGEPISSSRGGIIGAAIGVIVSSLIDDVLVPVAGLSHGRIDLLDLMPVTGNPNGVPVSPAKAGGTGVLNIGLFINAVVNSSVSPLVCFSSSRALTV